MGRERRHSGPSKCEFLTWKKLKLYDRFILLIPSSRIISSVSVVTATFVRQILSPNEQWRRSSLTRFFLGTVPFPPFPPFFPIRAFSRLPLLLFLFLCFTFLTFTSSCRVLHIQIPPIDFNIPPLLDCFCLWLSFAIWVAKFVSDLSEKVFLFR